MLGRVEAAEDEWKSITEVNNFLHTRMCPQAYACYILYGIVGVFFETDRAESKWLTFVN